MRHPLAPIVVAVAALGTAIASPSSSEATERAAVERAVLDYIEAIYDVRPELVERSVHVGLHKLGFARFPRDGSYRMLSMTYGELLEMSRTYNLQGRIPPNAVKRVEVDRLLDQTASATLTAYWGIESVHLARIDDRWKIVQILWQTRPPRPQSRPQSAPAD